MFSRLIAIITFSLVFVNPAIAQQNKYLLTNSHFDFKLALADMMGKDKAAIKLAINELARFGAPAIEDIFAFLAKGKYPEFKMGLANIALMYEEEAKPFLIAALQDDSKFIRLIAAKVIAEGVNENDTPIVGPFDEPIAPTTKRKWLKDADVRALMINTCDDGDVKVGMKAIEYCVYIKAKEAIPSARRIMADKSNDKEIRWLALEYLAEFDVGNANDLLDQVRDIPDFHSYVWSTIGTETAYQLALGLLRPELYPTTEAFNESLLLSLLTIGEFHRKDALPIARKYLTHSDSGARQGAAKLIGQVGGPAVIPELVELTKSKDIFIRTGAISGIADTKSPKAYALLCALVEKKDAVSPLAISGFRTLEDFRAIKFLEPYAKSKDAETKKAAIETIKFLKDLKRYGRN
jgi:HEAT repeat protein